MSQAIVVNGRFLAQPMSGVQRFALEITASLAAELGPRLEVLAPRGCTSDRFRVTSVGRRAGQSWEQFELPYYAGGRLLVNLGNTAPLLLGRQVVVLHDAGVYRTPGAYSRPFRLWYKLLHARLRRSGAGLVTVSASARADLAHCFGLAEGRIAVISEGADHMARLAANHGAAPEVATGRFVLAVGTLAAHKNLAALADLARRLERENVALVVTGRAGGAAFGNSAGQLPPAVRYAGRVSDADLKSLYQKAACLVLPSRYEGFGLPAAEAMACGCPVVAARIPALLETCEDAALYCDPADPGDITHKVLSVLADPTLAAQLREAGRRRAETLTWHRAGALLMEAIDRYTQLARTAVLAPSDPVRPAAQVLSES